MKLNKLFLVALVGSLFFASCSDNDDEATLPLGAYEKGFFVTNEGNGNSLGTVTFVSDNLTKVEQNVYGQVNNGDALGKYVQSIFFDGDKAYVIANGSSIITVVNRYTFKLLGKIQTGLLVPMYGVVKNGKAYISNSANVLVNDDDFVAVVNLNTLAVETTIPMNTIANKIIEENGKIYVSNGNYGNGSSVTVINPTSNTIEKVIDLGESPNSFEEENGILYVLCNSYSAPSKIVKISTATNQIISEIIFPTSLNLASNLNIEDGKIYYTVNSAAYVMNLTATTPSTTPLFDYNSTSLYGAMYGFNVKGNRIYAADAGDFASDSKVHVYTTAGTLVGTVTVGVGPNGCYFND